MKIEHFCGIKYKILDKSRIQKYVISIANKEWEKSDFEKYGNDLQLKFILKKVDLSKIKPNKKLLKTHEFKKDLGKRIKKVRGLISTDKSIPPLILRGKDLLIFDGYARFHVLRELGIKKCLAYVGKNSR
ncbi:MAG: hypothetical protein AABX14_00550 [Candidatus Aenigmatarchaeota archaeon]